MRGELVTELKRGEEKDVALSVPTVARDLASVSGAKIRAGSNYLMLFWAELDGRIRC